MAACKGISSSSLSHHQLLFSQTPVSESPRISIAPIQLNRRQRQQGVVLRSRLWVIEAIRPARGRTIFGSEGGNDLFVKNEKLRQCRCYAVGEVDGSRNGKIDEKRSCNRTAELVIAATFTVVMGVANRVLYKLALVPLKRYPFFLAQLATFGYFLLFLSISP